MAVTDQGPGIPEEDREKIFGSLYRLQNSNNVKVLVWDWLFAKSIIEAHEGEIKALNTRKGEPPFISVFRQKEKSH